jgi:two-component system, OmpR family, osmolarity sensor histidine kinase EnvZ
MRLAPRTLLGRTVLVIGAVLITSQLAVFQLVLAYTRGPLLEQMATLVARQLHTVSAALETLPESEREDFLELLEDADGVRVIRDLAGTLPSNEPQSPVLQSFADSLKAQLGEDIEFFVQKEHGKALWVRLQVGKDKYWVSIPRSQIENAPPWLWLGWAAFSALLVLLGAYLLVRRVNQPLRKLAQAAKRLGEGKTPPALPVAGPTEIREVSRAFNQMADDIRRHDDERALLLAGVSHDVRTPLSRLRIGLEVAGDGLDQELRNGMIEDIEEIDAIVGQFLNFARAAAEEPPQAVQLNSVIEATAKRYAGLGRAVKVESAPLPALKLRPVAIQRLLDNLIGNAVRYSDGEIVIRTGVQAGRTALSVLDRGPGIPVDQVERLKRPFTRLESARTGGGHAGLGLAIVDRIAAIHGAVLSLLPRDGGGLEARVTFPAEA